jgi:FkbM family methyltransferase
MTLKFFLSSLNKSYQQAKSSRFPRLQYKINAFFILMRLHLKCREHRSPGDVKETIFGFSITATSYEDLLAMFQEIALKLQYHFTTQKAAPRILDCGANIGFTVLLYKLLYPRSLIFAFEPDPVNYTLLVKNLKRNKIRNIKTFNACFSTKNEMVEFYPNNTHRMLGTLNPVSTNQSAIKVQAMRLSELLSTDVYDMVKIDSEGSEWEIIQDLDKTGTIINCNHYVVAFHTQRDQSAENIKLATSIFEKNGYQRRDGLPHYEQGELISFYKLSPDKV